MGEFMLGPMAEDFGNQSDQSVQYDKNKDLEYLVGCCTRLGYYEAAIEYARERIRILSDGKINPDKGITKEDLSGFREKERAGIIGSLNQLGLIYLLKSDLDAAVSYFENIREMAVHIVDNILYNLACARALKGEPEKMYETLEELGKINSRQLVKASSDEDFKKYFGEEKFERIISEAGEKLT